MYGLAESGALVPQKAANLPTVKAAHLSTDESEPFRLSLSKVQTSP